MVNPAYAITPEYLAYCEEQRANRPPKAEERPTERVVGAFLPRGKRGSVMAQVRIAAESRLTDEATMWELYCRKETEALNAFAPLS